jgi:uncharacterized membrane protein (UPF0182 family)
MRVPSSVEGRSRSFGLRGWLIGAAVVLVVLLLSLRGLARFYTDYLWFDDLQFSDTWRGLLSAKAVPALIFSSVFFVLMLVNLIVADRIAPRYRGTGPEDEIIERYRGYVAPYAGRVRVVVALFFAIVMGAGVSAQWQNWILFRNSTSFGIKDPQFGKDVSFYVFRLPFYQFAAGWTFAALLVVLIVTAVFHYLNGGIRLQSPFQRVTPQVKAHLSVLLALMALTKTVQYYLAQFALTKSNRGFVDGATYTDVNAQLPALRLLIIISIAAAVLFIINIWRRGWVFPIIAVGLWGFISIVVGTIYPAAIQRFTVQPNELSRERQFIERNITATRDAFNLAKIETKQFTFNPKLNAAAVDEANGTLESVRLWDPVPAGENFKVDEARSTAYEFTDVDADRYESGDEKSKPTMSAVRELDQAHLPDNSWTSRHLVYTHGYGVVAIAANEAAGDAPSYMLRNIPPQDTGIELKPDYSPVYFGESLSGYAVVGTKVPEQEAATTQATSYSGQGGVEVSSFLRKSALALRFGDWNLFVSGQLTGDSRALYIRDIRERVETIAPFLRFDADPYPVVIDGRITWMIDAYTITNEYPYSQSIHPEQPAGSGLDTDFNYVRNSVKATVDAYDGTVRFYIVDPNDPIIRTYQKAFPELFTDASEMPEDLREHWRYPEDLFNAQTEQYALYHITDPVQYFNKQDIWDIAPDPEQATATAVTTPPQAGNDGGRNTTLAATNQASDPLYLTMQLPGEREPEFTLQRAFTPRRKGGILSSFAFARTDGDNYGKLVVYSINNSDNAPSAAQAASAIQSDTFISQQFTLLGQGGSKVEKGQVQLLPIGDAVLYVRPIWVTGQSAQQKPRYRFVAAVAGDRAVLGYNIDDATDALLSGRPTELQNDIQRGRSITEVGPEDVPTDGTTTTTAPPNGTTPTTTTPGTAPPDSAGVEELLAHAQTEFEAAQDALTREDLGAYQQHIAAAREDVRRARALLRGTSATTTPTTAPPPTTTP